MNTPAFLKIDVEGHELSVISSADWVKKKPLVVVVEAIDAITLEPNHEEWEPLLLDAGYTFAYFDGINRFYGRHPKTVSRLQIDLPTLPQYPRS